MSDLKNNDESDEIDFYWGVKRGRGGQKKEVQFYESFTYDGVEYFLYDSVYLFKEGEDKPCIGKLIKIWEHSNKARKVKVLWFFHPFEISNYISNENVLENELFLATGVGKGLANVNPLEAIAGKCNVVCISKDERNRQPAVEEVKMAHYVFYRTFDVQTHAISDKLGEKIAMIEVNFLLNKNGFKLPDLPMVDSENVAVVHDAGEGSQVVEGSKVAKSLLDNSKCHPVESGNAAGPDNTGPVVGMERKLITEDPNGANEVLEYDGIVGSLLIEDEEESKGKVDAAGADNLSPVTLPAAEVALASSKKSRSRSPDSIQNNLNNKVTVLPSDDRVTKKSKLGDSVHSLDQNAMNGLTPVKSRENKSKDTVTPVTVTDDRKSKQVNGNLKDTNAIEKVKSDDKQLKKRKLDGTAVLSENGGTSTPKLATVMSKKAPKFVGPGTDGSAGGKSNDKLCKVPAKESEDMKESAATNVAAAKSTQPTDVDAETHRDNLNKKVVGASNGPSKRLKSNIKVEDKSNDKNIKIEHTSNDKNVKVEHKSNDKLRKTLVKEDSKDAEIGARVHVIEVTQRPNDRSKWFTASPWEDRMKDARDQRRLVLLQNLDPTYTSSEVENIVWHGFGESCTAKMLQHTETSCQHSGQALVICKTKEAADKIVSMLENKCLMLPNGRPVIGSREVVCFPGKRSSFPGHLVIDKLRHQLQRESREAVSTSHSSQPNTIEYEMALEWRLLQEKSDWWWKMMQKKQGEEIKKLKASLRSQKSQMS